jgi:hypothetical protein
MSRSFRGSFDLSRHIPNDIRMARKKIIHPVIVFNNLNTPLIMGIDTIHHMGTTYLSTSETYLFQEDITGENNSEKLVAGPH